MNKKILTAASVAILAAGGIYLGISGDDVELPTEEEYIYQRVGDAPDKKTFMDGMAVSMTMKEIRVVGGNRGEVVPSETLGEAVSVTVDDETLCNVILETKGGKSRFASPSMGDLKSASPVMVGCGDSSCMWNVMVYGQSCLQAPDLDGYIGSSMEEVVKLTLPQKKILLIQQSKDGLQWVPFGSENADPEGEIRFGHEWSGSPVNFEKMKGSQKEDKFKEATDIYLEEVNKARTDYEALISQ